MEEAKLQQLIDMIYEKFPYLGQEDVDTILNIFMMFN